MANSANSAGQAAAVAGLDSLLIAPRFCGPPGTGNGGYVSGRVAAYLDSASRDGACRNGPVTVTLRKPPPLDAHLAVARDGEGALRVTYDGTLIAEAAGAGDGPPLEVPERVSAQQAHTAAGRAAYYADPVFPSCFVCGTDREPGDGLRIFPGPVYGRPLWAAPWTPDKSVTDDDGTVRQEMVWAALDCPSGIAAAEAAGLSADTAILLGRITASLAAPPTALPAAGDECRVVAWPEGRDGRKLTAGSALLAPDGEVLAAARTVWLTIPRATTASAGEPAGAYTAPAGEPVHASRAGDAS